MKKYILLLLLFAIVALNSCTNNYSSGNRVGIITKFSYKGIMFNSWEGDLKVAPGIANQKQNSMIGQYEDFLFSIDNDKKIECVTTTDSINQFMKEGIPVDVQYQQVTGFNCFTNRGETDYFIKSITRLK